MSKPIVIKEIQVVAATGSLGSGTTYTANANEGITISNEAEELLVGSGQTMLNKLNSGFEFIIYDTDILADALVNDSGADGLLNAKLFLVGETGSDTLSIDNVNITAVRDFSTPRSGVKVKVTKSAAASQIVVA